MASLCQEEEEERQRRRASSKSTSFACTGESFWDTFVRLPRPPGDVVFFAQGAVFAVTAEQVRRRPRAEYAALLAAVSGARDTAAGFFLEWLWYYVLTSDPSPCPLSGSEFDWAKIRPYYKALPLQERVKYLSSDFLRSIPIK